MPAIAPSSEHWIGTAHGRLYARRWQAADDAGQLAPIVLLHDSLGCVQLWRDFPARLAAHSGRTVIGYDRLGFGRSDPHHDSLGADFIQQEAAEFFPALRAHFDLQRFVVLGHSVGGGMAVQCAARYASACDGLITIAAQAFVEERTRQGILAAQRQFQQPEPRQRLQRYHGAKAPWVLAAWIDTWLSPAFADWSLQPVLPQVRCASLVLHGSDDEYGSRRHPEQLAAGLGGPVQLELMPAVRHLPHREQEAWVLARIARFLAPAAGG
ncbi:alpha/beta fold hydrolase [Vogesella facilis]|uniref:Alpha/beta fold hydrolase n=1 Tax=Vogesella facilis TaxID=1655232 RepID=A0ABV7RLE4_9NEIS